MSIIIPADRMNEEREILNKITKGEKVEQYETIRVRKDGHQIYVSLTLSPIYDRTHNLIAVSSISNDITGQKNMENALSASEMKYRVIYESSTDAIILLNKDGRFMSGNPAAIKMFKCKNEAELIMQDVLKLSPEFQPDGESSANKSRRIIAAALKSGANNFEWTHKRLDGTDFEASVLLSRMEVEGSRILQANVRDVTELKKAEKAVKDAMEMKEEFISMASHELRSPMATIKESFEIINDGIIGKTDPGVKKFIDIARRNIDRLVRLSNNILDMQKLETGGRDFNIKPNDINTVINDTLNSLSFSAKDKKLEIKVSLSEKIPEVYFDRDAITQVLTNLLSNAFKFTKTGGIKITSSVEMRNLLVSVTDTGVGISKEDLSRLFKKFQQVGPTWMRQGGTGLGLAICKEIIEHHGGNIWVESELGAWTKFSFTLPLAFDSNRAMRT